MRTTDLDVLMVPGYTGSGAEHWQTRWLKGIKSAWLVEQDDWDKPDVGNWTDALVTAVERAPKPVLLVAHSIGVLTVVHAARRFRSGKVVGGFLVAPPDVEDKDRIIPELDGFAPYPRDPLPFPSLLIASRTDVYCDFSEAEEMAYAWGARLVDAGDAGHINTASGHGPWPEGLMTFAQFLSRL